MDWRVTRSIHHTWAELTGEFMGKFFPPSKCIQLKDEINSDKCQALQESWLKLKKKIVQCLNHRLPNEVLLKSFYKSLVALNKSVETMLQRIH